MFKIKELPEDFYVKELIDFKLKDKGEYKIYSLNKKNYNTLDAIEIISNRFKLNEVGYCGNKDKNAVTEQFISIKGNVNLENLNIKDISLKFQGYLDKRLSLGDNSGNYFKIVVRNLEKKYKKVGFIVNYFDEQRFSEHNSQVGKMLLQKKFKEICQILEIDSKNPIDSLNRINKKLLKLYLHSYQSYLFNKVVSIYLSKSKKVKKVKYSLGEFVFVDKFEKLKFPLLSFDTEFGKKDKIYLEILKEEGIKLDDFIIRSFPALLDETTHRDVFVKVKDFKTLSYDKDELNPGMFKQEISFILPKGSYATILVKEMFEKK